MELKKGVVSLIETFRGVWEDSNMKGGEMLTRLPPRSHPRVEQQAPPLAFSCV
jgi:hypothetical protein